VLQAHVFLGARAPERLEEEARSILSSIQRTMRLTPMHSHAVAGPSRSSPLRFGAVTPSRYSNT